jgi:hypothetical protein
MDPRTKAQLALMRGFLQNVAELPEIGEQNKLALQKVSAVLGVTEELATHPEKFMVPMIEGETADQYEARAKKLLSDAIEEAARRINQRPSGGTHFADGPGEPIIPRRN